MLGSTDWMLVLIAALVNLAIGYVWYSHWLFGSTWLKLAELKSKDVKRNKNAILWTCLNSLVIAFFLEFFARHVGVDAVTEGVFLGFIIWLGFVATTQIASVIWRRKPFQLFLIDSGYKLLSFLVMGGIVGA